MRCEDTRMNGRMMNGKSKMFFNGSKKNQLRIARAFVNNRSESKNTTLHYQLL